MAHNQAYRNRNYIRRWHRVCEIGCKQAVNRSANEFILNAFVVLPVMVINRLISGNLAYPQSKTTDKPGMLLDHMISLRHLYPFFHSV